MLDSEGFDKWSGDYDQSILDSKGYPFEGYYNVLGYVQKNVKAGEGIKILDLGIGTGLLTYELYENGAKIFGVDFSEEMLKKARKKMPDAVFIKFDFSAGLPKKLLADKFDYIISSYAIHHIDDAGKLMFIRKLQDNLRDGGKIIFADVAFETYDDFNKCKINAGDSWDEDEYYMIGNEMVRNLKSSYPNVTYTQISSCAGVLEISI